MRLFGKAIQGNNEAWEDFTARAAAIEIGGIDNG